jgi:cytochrome c-type biogenesis protein
VTLAFGPQGSWAVYLTAGMVATVNPCGFAMLPAYLSYFLGLDGRAESSAQAGVAEALRVAGAVSAGFLAVFAVAAAVVEAVGASFVYDHAPWLSIVIGLALLALGVAMLCGVEVVTRLPKLDRGGRTRTIGSMFAFGVSYAVASIGCTLPLFLISVTGTIKRESVADGLVVFGLYALGMTIVLASLTVAIALARTGLVHLLRRSQQYVGRVAGGLVALTGAYVAYYGWLELRVYGGGGRVPESAVTDRVTDWSFDASGWVADVGAVRLAVVLAVALAAVVGALAVARRSSGGPEGSDPSQPGQGPQGASRASRQPVADAGSRS